MTEEGGEATDAHVRKSPGGSGVARGLGHFPKCASVVFGGGGASLCCTWSKELYGIRSYLGLNGRRQEFYGKKELKGVIRAVELGGV